MISRFHHRLRIEHVDSSIIVEAISNSVLKVGQNSQKPCGTASHTEYHKEETYSANLESLHDNLSGMIDLHSARIKFSVELA